jgi:hypothetical protein
MLFEAQLLGAWHGLRRHGLKGGLPSPLDGFHATAKGVGRGHAFGRSERCPRDSTNDGHGPTRRRQSKHRTWAVGMSRARAARRRPAFDHVHARDVPELSHRWAWASPTSDCGYHCSDAPQMRLHCTGRPICNGGIRLWSLTLQSSRSCRNAPASDAGDGWRRPNRSYRGQVRPRMAMDAATT